MKKIPRLASLPILLSAMLLLNGCVSVRPSYEQVLQNAEMEMRTKTKAVFNPQGMYAVGPEGLWVPNLMDVETETLTGPIYLPPGTIVAHDDEAVADKE